MFDIFIFVMGEGCVLMEILFGWYNVYVMVIIGGGDVNLIVRYDFNYILSICIY